MIKVRDLIAAEEAAEAAEAEYRKLNDNPEQWSAYESLDRQGKRHLNVAPGHLERRQYLLDNVTAARQSLVQMRKAFAEGGL